DHERLTKGFAEAVAARRTFSGDARVRRADGRFVWMNLRIAPVVDPGGTVREWFGAAVDISSAKQSDALRELFVGMLGHDLRAPVSAIKTGAELALRRGLPEAQARTIGRILNSTERMGRMIDQALDFARARPGGGIPIAPAPMDLGEVATRIVSEH